MLNRARGDAEGFGNIGDLPGRAGLPSIAEQQGAGVNELRSGSFPVARERFEFAAFFWSERDFVSWCHCGSVNHNTGQVNIRN